MGLAGTSCHAPPRGRARVLVCVCRHPTRHCATPPFPLLHHPRGGGGVLGCHTPHKEPLFRNCPNPPATVPPARPLARTQTSTPLRRVYWSLVCTWLGLACVCACIELPHSSPWHHPQ